jgi:hypothetical protein
LMYYYVMDEGRVSIATLGATQSFSEGSPSIPRTGGK